MGFDEMVADFAVRRGIPGGLVPDANRQVRWTIRGDGDGNDVDFVCREIPMYMATFIKARVCPLPVAGTAQFTAEMMRANYHCRGTAGGTLSIDDEGVVYAHFIFGTPSSLARRSTRTSTISPRWSAAGGVWRANTKRSIRTSRSRPCRRPTTTSGSG